MRPWILLAALLPCVASAAGHEVSLGVTTVSTSSFFRSTASRWGLDAGYAYGLGAWRLGGGVRLALPRGAASVPLELYARALLSARWGSWMPAVGPELGLSGLSVLEPRTTGLPEDIDALEGERLGNVYLAFHAAPLRFAVRGFTVSALELQWGTTFTPPGGTLRLQVGLLHVGVPL
jgi:hypothetical protein